LCVCVVHDVGVGACLHSSENNDARELQVGQRRGSNPGQAAPDCIAHRDRPGRPEAACMRAALIFTGSARSLAHCYKLFSSSTCARGALLFHPPLLFLWLMNAAASKDFFISMSRGSPLCFDYECGGLFVCMDWRSFSSDRAADFCHYTPQPCLIKYLPATVGLASLQFSVRPFNGE
jgi:hypothetical protein